MAMTSSSMVDLGSTAPLFNLTDTITGNQLTLDKLKGEKATVILFICNHCPYVIHIREAVVTLAAKYMPLGVSFIAISSNDVANYPADSPDKMKEIAIKCQFPFPYLYDESQEVAKAYEAACTPDIYLYNESMKLKYRGQFDGSRPSNKVLPTGEDLEKAIKAVLQGESPSKLQRPSIGCNIKWK